MPSDSRARICRKIVTFALPWIAVPAVAFHDGGSAHCGGCHIAHDSQDGISQPAGGLYSEGLLKAETPSDLCLSCHADSVGTVFGQDPLTPYPERGGGNFIFLLEDNLNDSPTLPGVIPGDAAGHNVEAPGHGLTTDSRWSTSPGGGFPAFEMECTSCHDPHGNTNFRMLYGVGSVQGGLFSFTRPAPEAVGTDLISREATTNHTAYRSGVSDWCGNCHGRFHQGGPPGEFRHNSDIALGGQTSARYNSYNGDSDPTGGAMATAYLPQVPFEDSAARVDSASGAFVSSRVMCLSCHRAHASSAPAAGRWDFNVDKLSEDGVLSGSYALPDPYADPAQGSLCQKCHENASPATVP